MQDQRLVTRLQNYWDLIRRGKPMPEIHQLNPSVIEDLWQSCMKIEATHAQGGTSYSYRFVGEKLVAMFGRDLTNNTVDLRMSQYPYGVLVKALEDVMQTRKFALSENQFVNEKGNVVKYRGCVMPFGNEARGVTHLVVGLSDKTY